MTKKQILSIVLAGILVVVFGVWFYFEKKTEQSAPASEEEIVTYGTTEFLTYTNAKGKRWLLPKAGKHSFYVASENKYPKFIKGVIDPLKVSIGDIQKMEIVVENPGPLKNVWAEIEHDRGKDIVVLELVSENVVSQKDLNLPFIVDENNHLLPVTSKNKSRIEKIVDNLIERAKAQGIVQYTYRGEWKVHSTQTITYHTTFIAQDKEGNIDKLVLAWSDPCSFEFPENKINRDCTLTASVDGLELTSIGFTGGYTVTLASGGVFVWNPGYSIVLEKGGKFSIDSGGELRQAYLYYNDADPDGDLYSSTSTKSWSSSPGPIAGKIRVSSALGTDDCYDATPTSTTRAHLVYPGQTQHFSVPRGDGSFDYDCDGRYSVTYVDSLQNPSFFSDLVAGHNERECLVFDSSNDEGRNCGELRFEGTDGCASSYKFFNEGLKLSDSKKFEEFKFYSFLKNFLFKISKAVTSVRWGWWFGGECFTDAFPCRSEIYSLCR